MLSLEYIAGYFDGEGCVTIGITNKKYYQLCVKIDSIDFEPLHMIHKMFGGGLSLSKRRPPRHHTWHFRLSTNIAYKFLKAIQPYCILKKQQVDLALEFQENIQGFKKRGWQGTLPKDEIIKRLWYKKTLSMLKTKNQGVR